jgi:hypothetical protein
MSEDKNADIEKKFTDWLENKTGQNHQQIDEESFTQESVWHERMSIANHIAHHVDISPEYDVPNWDRTSAFESDKKPWWQWSALPAMSFAFS